MKLSNFVQHPSLKCQEHGLLARYRTTSEHVYGGRDYGPIWECPLGECDRICGVHPNGKPLGILASKALRAYRMDAHELFDQLWKPFMAQQLAYPEESRPNKKLQGAMRYRAYGWLAEQMGMKRDDCHIAMMVESQIEAIFKVFAEHKPTSATIRAWHKAKGK